MTSREPFGTLPDGRPVERFVLEHDGLRVGVLTYGAVLQQVVLPDGTDVVLGFDDLEGYLSDTAYLGAVVGRFANRLAGGRFTLDGTAYEVPVNNGPNALHGGPEGFSSRLWDAREVDGGVELSLVSPDGDMGFPGTLTASVTYRLDGHGLHLSYLATTDAPTVVNLTNHAYWNLAGGGTIEDHELELPAGSFVDVDDVAIPTGELAPVDGTVMDFQDPHPIGQDLRSGAPQLLASGGYDHCWVLHGDVAGRLRHPASGRTLEVRTDQPGVQFYSGNFLDGTVVGKGGRTYRQSDGLCLETQHFPDSPNQPDFPSTVLRPGGQYRTTTTYRLG